MDLLKETLAANGFPDFNPMQKLALEKDWQNSNLVVSAPTASGKTVVAELLSLNSVINRKRKVLYVCPLKAIASEHYSSFRKKYSKSLDIRVAISTGDLDSSSTYLGNYDIIFSTYEKVDSIIRHKAEWLSSVGLLVVDEIHTLDSDRGPTIEMMVTALRHINSKMQILALSATIPNAKEIAEWLSAELVFSEYRPVKLVEKVYLDGIFYNGKEEEIKEEDTPVESIVSDTLLKEKQALVFANTRKRAQQYAEKLSWLTEKKLTEPEKEKLGKEAELALNVLDHPTEQCALLSNLIKRGVAFHHAGLMQKQREIIEEAFRKSLIKIVSCTPTLAAGVNLPAFRVVISSLHRYTSAGNQRISVNEYKQICGRAGRPAYDTTGESILIAKNDIEKDELFESFINGKPEDINSKLSYVPVLRMQLLASIANGFVLDLLSLEDFIKKTFYYSQNKDSAIISEIMPLLTELNEMGFIEGDEQKFAATALGKRVSELYLDPTSAYKMINSLKQDAKGDLFYLYLISNTTEFYPWVTVKKDNEDFVWQELQENGGKLPVNLEKEQFEDYNILAKFNCSLMLNEWISEKSEEEILKKYNMQPGVLYAKKEIADWLIYSALEIAKLLSLEQHYPALAKIRKRIEYGVREELVSLVAVRHIGRVRARRLYNSNIRTVSELKKVDIKDLSRILGEKVAEKVKEQLQ